MMRPRFKALFIAVVCFGIILQTSAILPSAGYEDFTEEIWSKYSTNAFVIDGSAFEYKEEYATAIRYIGLGQSLENLWLMHDTDYFYISIWMWDNTYDIGDAIAIFLDEGNDGGYGSGSGDKVLTEGQEDCKMIYGNGQLMDGYYEERNWHFTADPAQIDFEAAIRYFVNRWEAEFKIPFKGTEGNPDDKSDLNINRTDSIGIIICLCESSGSKLSYPVLSDALDASTYSTLRFDNYSPSISGISFSPNRPQPGDTVMISATVTDQESGLYAVNLRYATEIEATWYTIPMEAESGSTYTVTMPEQPEGTTVWYRIEAMDISTSATTSAESSYTVETLILGMSPTIFYILTGVLVVAAVSFVVLKSRKSKKLQTSSASISRPQ